MRDGIERLTHVKRYSRFYGTICVGIAWPGYVAGTGRHDRAPIRAKWRSRTASSSGAPTPSSTQVNVMTHAMRARKERGAKIVAIDIYETETMRQADLALRLRPGTDGALACAVMHVLFRDGFADRDYLARYTDAPGANSKRICERATRPGRARSPASRSRKSKPSPRSSARRSAPSSASATASRASATARPTCMRRSASRR